MREFKVDKDLETMKARTASFCVQLKELTKRQRTLLKGDPRVFKAKIGQTIFIGLLILSVFWDLKDDSYNGTVGKLGAAFFLSINQTMMNLMGTVLTFSDERPVFLREQANQTYGVVPYYFSKLILEMPIIIITPLLLNSIVYFGIGFEDDAGNFFRFYLAMLCLVISATSFGYFLSSIFTKAEIAVQITPVIMMPLILFGGFFTNVESTPDWLEWIQYISPIRYSLEAMVRIEYADKHISYNGQVFDPIKRFDLNIGLTECFIALIVLGVVLRILALIALKVLVQRFQ